MTNSVTQQIEFKTIQGSTGISVDTSDPETITITNTASTLLTDTTPSLGYHMNARNFMIGNLRPPNDSDVAAFNSVYFPSGINNNFDPNNPNTWAVPISSFAINQGYADARYINRTGDVMLSTLFLHDHPLPLSGTNPPGGFYLDSLEESYAKQAATKYYVDAKDQDIYNYVDAQDQDIYNFIENNLGTSSDVQFNSLTVTEFLATDQLSLENNTISSTNSNGDIILSPNGTGKVLISGDLQVDGASTIINSTVLEIDDINIIIARGATTASAANGGGITLEGPTVAAQITYASADDSWNINKKTSVLELQVDNINVSGNTISAINSDGDIILDPNSAGNVNVSNAKITNLAEPLSAQDAATKSYVDTSIKDGTLTVEGGYGLSGTGTFTANQGTSSTITLALDNTVVKKDVTINAFAYYELTPSTEFGETIAVDDVITVARILDNNPSSPTYNMKINAESIAVIAYTATTIRVYNDSSSTEVFDIVLKI